MDNVKAEIGINSSLVGDIDSGLGEAKDSVSLSGLGISVSGAGKKFYHKDEAISNPENYDLNDGTLKDAFGVGIVMTTLYAIYIRNNTGGTLQIGAAASPIDIFGTPATHTFELVDNGVFVYLNSSGLTLTPATSDMLKIAGAAGAIDIIIVGA